MYARIARFEGGTAAAIEAEAEKIRDDVLATQAGETGSYMPQLSSIVKKVEVLADKKHGKVAVIVYCDTEEQLRHAERLLNSMSPSTPEWGERVSAEVYEVIAQEETRLRRAA